MPTLDWIGKNKVINHHQDVPYRVLERQYSFDKQGQHTEDNGSENMVIHGDNLEALKSLLPRYEGNGENCKSPAFKREAGGFFLRLTFYK